MSLTSSASTLALQAVNKLTSGKAAGGAAKSSAVQGQAGASSSATKRTYTPVAPASWRGISFAVTSTETNGGRRVALHQYPGKEVGWAEDMGRQAERYVLRGFVVDGDVTFGGAAIALQRAQLVSACEKKGTGTLVHPTMGSLTVMLERWSIGEGLEASNYSEVSLEFIASGQQAYPTSTAAAATSTTSTTTASGYTKTTQTTKAASKLKTALIKIAASTVATLVSGGSISTSTILAEATGVLSLAGVRADIVGAIAGWSTKIIAFAQDATALFRISAVLPAASGTSYGRYSAGANAGLTGSNPTGYTPDTTIDDLITDASAEQAAVSTAASTLASTAAAADLTDISDVGTAATALIEALLACCADPADAIRILLGVLSASLTGLSTSATQVITTMIWRAAAAALTDVVAQYQPSSLDDAAARLAQIAPVLDALAVAAADAGEDDAW
ncbi:MAG TPA: DNA circularization N-terminal domain-containing protein, partial [Novosphingobium sp.]|nr:DNA circularization N-terminal domain-containing protein [Novosphingobium sp.]